MSLAFSMVPSAEALSRARHVSLLLTSYLLHVCLYLRTVGVTSSSPPHSQCLQLCQPAKTVEMLSEDRCVAAIHGRYGKPCCQREGCCSLLLSALLGERKADAMGAQRPLQLVGEQADSDREA